jgi:hypothetical protein
MVASHFSESKSQFASNAMRQFFKEFFLAELEIQVFRLRNVLSRADDAHSVTGVTGHGSFVDRGIADCQNAQK